MPTELNEVFARKQTSAQKRKRKVYAKKRAARGGRRLTTGPQSAKQKRGAKLRGKAMKRSGMAKKISKFRESDEFRTHTPEYISLVTTAATDPELGLDEAEMKDLVTAFMKRDTAYSRTKAGIAALKFEALMYEMEKNIAVNFIETVVTQQDETFIATFSGKIKPQDLKRLAEKTKMRLEAIVEAGTHVDGEIVDVTIIEGIDDDGASDEEEGEPAIVQTDKMTPALESLTDGAFRFAYPDAKYHNDRAVVEGMAFDYDEETNLWSPVAETENAEGTVAVQTDEGIEYVTAKELIEGFFATVKNPQLSEETVVKFFTTDEYAMHSLFESWSVDLNDEELRATALELAEQYSTPEEFDVAMQYAVLEAWDLGADQMEHNAVVEQLPLGESTDFVMRDEVVMSRNRLRLLAEGTTEEDDDNLSIDEAEVFTLVPILRPEDAKHSHTEHLKVHKDSKAKVVKEIKQYLKVPFVSAQVSTLGGDMDASLMLTISLDKKEDMKGGMLQNSRTANFKLDRNGALEQFSKSYKIPTKKMRKTKVTSLKAAAQKINAWVDKAAKATNESFEPHDDYAGLDENIKVGQKLTMAKYKDEHNPVTITAIKKGKDGDTVMLKSASGKKFEEDASRMKAEMKAGKIEYTN